MDIGNIFFGWYANAVSVPSANRTSQYIGNRRIPNMLMPFDSTVNAYMKGYMDKKSMEYELNSGGYDITGFNFSEALLHSYDPDWKKNNTPMFTLNVHAGDLATTPCGAHIAANMFNPTNDELMVMRNRGLLSHATFANMVERNTCTNGNWWRMYDELRFIIPPVSDLISFAVREAFNTEVITKFGYNKELPIEILPWLEKQGLGGGTNFKLPPNSTTTIGADNREYAQWFDHYWWAHWQLPSLSAGYEMLHRFYPDSRYGASPFVLKSDGSIDDDLVFTQDEMDTLHKTQDYPPYWRKRLSAMSYLPLTRTDVRRMRQVGVFKTPVEVYHAYRAIGYDDTNANRLSQFTEELVKPKNRRVSQQAAKLICKAKSNGLIASIDAISQLKTLGYNDDDAKAYIAQCDVENQIKDKSDAIKLLRRAYLKGYQPEDRIVLALETLGVDIIARGKLFAKWYLERSLKWRELTVTELKKALKNSHIDDAEFTRRLTNLGYPLNDINIEIDNVQSDIDKEFETEAKRGMAYFNAKKIGELYNAGILDKEDILRILKIKGWSQLAIDSFLLEQQI